MLNKIITLTIILICLTLTPVLAQKNLGQILAGRILLQVESHGEAWYVNPVDQKKYYLGRPTDAFSLMNNLGIGITNADLNKIPIGIINYNDADDDNDGLANRLENALDTDPNKTDTDNDGYNDKIEILNDYNPLGQGKLNIDENFTNNNLGKIFLQVEKAGQAWYLNPVDQKRYFLSRPSDAFNIMRSLSLGITDENITKIKTGYYIETPVCSNCNANNETNNQTANQVISAAANAIRQGNKSEVVSYFIPEMQKAVEYTMDFLSADSRLILGNILSGATLSSSEEDQKIYSTEVYFSLGGYKVPINFYIKKQPDGTWLLTNL
ncbi:MAG: hypothetical protein ABH830_03850 [Patescibacteria group bacterium]